MTFKKGLIPWNKGLTKETDERIRTWALKHSGVLSPHYGKKLSEEHKKNISKNSVGMTGKKHSLATRRKLSAAKSGKNNPNYGIPRSEETKEKISLAQRGRKNHNYGKQITPEVKLKMSLARKNKKHTKATREKIRTARLKQILPIKDTSIELALQTELTKRKIIFEKHIPVCGICQPDIVFPLEKVAVFADGDYWHSKAFDDGRRWNRDRTNDETLQINGWVVLRFWETAINEDVLICVDKIVSTLKMRDKLYNNECPSNCTRCPIYEVPT